MSCYAIGDVHGCYDALERMLEKICFSAGDRLYLVGDIIDRGPQSLEMLRWLERRPENVTVLRGNHEEEFAAYVAFLRQVDRTHELETDEDSAGDTAALYDTARYMLKKTAGAAAFFDVYGTLGRLVHEERVSLRELSAWAQLIEGLPYFAKETINERPGVIVHAGYREGGFSDGQAAAEFFLYAREEAYRSGGLEHGTVVAGHTPTVLKGEPVYNAGKVFRLYDKARDCLFYDIDCGCALSGRYPEARLACLRLDDEEIIYVKNPLSE